MKAALLLVGAFNKEKALVGAFSVKSSRTLKFEALHRHRARPAESTWKSFKLESLEAAKADFCRFNICVLVTKCQGCGC